MTSPSDFCFSISLSNRQQSVSLLHNYGTHGVYIAREAYATRENPNHIISSVRWSWEADKPIFNGRKTIFLVALLFIFINFHNHVHSMYYYTTHWGSFAGCKRLGRREEDAHKVQSQAVRIECECIWCTCKRLRAFFFSFYHNRI